MDSERIHGAVLNFELFSELEDAKFCIQDHYDESLATRIIHLVPDEPYTELWDPKSTDVTFDTNLISLDAPWHGRSQPRKGQYVMHGSQGQGDCELGGYPDLESALADFRAHAGEMSIGIKYPNGQWHQFSDADSKLVTHKYLLYQGYRDGDEDGISD